MTDAIEPRYATRVYLGRGLYPMRWVPQGMLNAIACFQGVTKDVLDGLIKKIL